MSDRTQIVEATSTHQPPAVVQAADPYLAMIERAARDPQTDVAKMERLFALSAEAGKLRAKSDFYAALALMQRSLPAVARRGKAHGDRRYARFEDVIEAVRPVLTDHGFSLTYRMKQTDDRMICIGVLGHAGGHTEETEISLPQDMSGSKNPVQAWASSAQYGKRYVTLAILGIATEDDDDGEAAGKKQGPTVVTDKQAHRLTALIDESKADVKKFLTVYRAASVSDIRAADFSHAEAALLKKIDKAKPKDAANV